MRLSSNYTFTEYSCKFEDEDAIKLWNYILKIYKVTGTVIVPKSPNRNGGMFTKEPQTKDFALSVGEVCFSSAAVDPGKK